MSNLGRLRGRDARQRGKDAISRRDLLKAGVGATVAPLAGGLAPTATAGAAALATVAAATPAAAATATSAAGLFFTASELALLEELTEMIVPADEHSGGAREAGVAAYIDRTLAEKDPRIEDHAAERQRFKEGLARVDELAQTAHARAFLDAAPSERIAVLERMAAKEGDPQAPEERFFDELKRATTHAYYSSRVGMIDDIEYQGNRVIREFAGTDVSKS